MGKTKTDMYQQQKQGDNTCFKYCVQPLVYDRITTNHTETMFPYNNLNDNK